MPHCPSAPLAAAAAVRLLPPVPPVLTLLLTPGDHAPGWNPKIPGMMATSTVKLVLPVALAGVTTRYLHGTGGGGGAWQPMRDGDGDGERQYGEQRWCAAMAHAASGGRTA